MRTWSIPARIRAGMRRGRMNQMSLKPVLAPSAGRLGSFQYAMPVAATAKTRRTTLESSRGLRCMRALYDTPWAILLSSQFAALIHAPDDSVEALHSRAGGAVAASRGGRVEVLARPRRGPALRAAGAGSQRPARRPPARR